MVVQTVDIVNYYPAESYTYSDESGDFESIVMEGGTVTSLSASAADSGSGSTATAGVAPATASIHWAGAADPVSAFPVRVLGVSGWVWLLGLMFLLMLG